MDIVKRVETRLGKHNKTEIVEELVQTICDRICLRVKASEFPEVLASIAVDATVKAFNRINYEGISSENDDAISTSFITDILDEYESEFAGYMDMLSDEDTADTEKVRFL